MARERIAGTSAETEVSMGEALARVEARLAALESVPKGPETRTGNFAAVEGQFIVVEAPPEGLVALLPKSRPQNRGKRITFSFKNANPVRLLAIGSRVNNQATVVSTSPGTFDAISDGQTGWFVAQGVTPEGSASGGEVLLGAAHPGWPDGRVATDSAEIDADTTVPNLVTWLLRTASVAFGKLQDLTGLSVLGRAASSTGVMAAITATAPRQALMSDAAGTAIAWRSITSADTPAHTWAETLAAGATSGTNNPVVDAGQFLQLGAVGPTTSNPQIRSGDATLRIRGAGNLFAFADGASGLAALVTTGASGMALLQAQGASGSAQVVSAGGASIEGATTALLSGDSGNASVLASAAGVDLSSGGLTRLVIEPDGSWQINSTNGTAGQYLRSFGSAVTPQWASLALADFPSQAADTFLGRLAGTGAPAPQALADVDSTSIVYDAASHTFQRAALTGAITANQNSNATLFDAGASGAGLTGGGTAVLAVGAGTRITVNANDVQLAAGAAETFLGNFTSGSAVADYRAGSSVAGAGLTYSAGGTLAVGAGTGITANANDVAWDGVDVRKNSAGSVFTRRRLNLIEGSGIALTVTDDAGNGEVDITVAASGGSAHVIRDNGSDETNRAALNFVSSTSVTLVGTDDAGNGETEITAQRAALTGEVTAGANANATTITRSTDFETSAWTGNHRFEGDVKLVCDVHVLGRNDLTLAANANDVSMADLNVLRVVGNGFALTGVVATGGNGKTIQIFNADQGDPLIIANENAGSTAANRFSCPDAQNYLLAPRSGVWARYDDTADRWFLLAPERSFRDRLLDPRYVHITDTFITTHGTGTAVNGYSVLGWAFDTAGVGSIAPLNGVAGHPGILRITTGTTQTTDRFMHLPTPAGVTGGPFMLSDVYAMQWIIRVNQTANRAVIVGVGDNANSLTLGSNSMYWITDSATDGGEWHAHGRAAAASTENDDTGVAPGTGWHVLTIVKQSNGDWAWDINRGAAVGTIPAADVPTNVAMTPVIYIDDKDSTNAIQVDVDEFTMVFQPGNTRVG